MRKIISKLPTLALAGLMTACASSPTTGVRTYAPPLGEEWRPRSQAETKDQITSAVVNEGWERIHEISYGWYTSGGKVIFTFCEIKQKGLGSKVGTTGFETCHLKLFYSGVSAQTTDSKGRPETYTLKRPSFKCIGNQPYIFEKRWGGMVLRSQLPTGGSENTVLCTALNG